MALQSFSATIGGATKAIRDVRYSSVINGVGQASFVVDDLAGAYVPADDAVVVLSLGGAPAWAGEVADVDVTYAGEAGLSCRVTAHDYNQIAQRILVNAPLPAQALKATLEYLVNAVGMSGVTLAAGQVTGPSLGAITAPWWTAETLLNHLASLTGYVWRINASKVLEMWDVGTRASGVTLSRGNGNVHTASWQRQRFDYRNRQWVLYGPAQIAVFVTDAGEVAAHGEWNAVVTVPDILTEAEATAYGDALIAANLPRVQMPVVVTRSDGIDAGETVAIDLSDVGLSSVTVLAQQIDTTLIKAESQVDTEHCVTCAAGSVAMSAAAPRDLWRRMLTGSAGGSAVVSGGGGITTITGQTSPVWFGGGEGVRTRVATAGAWVRGFDGGEVILDSTKLPPTIDLSVLMLGDVVTSGNAQCRVVGTNNNWVGQTVCTPACTPVTSGTTWGWQSLAVTLQTGVWAYRMEMTSSVNNSDVGFRVYLQW